MIDYDDQEEDSFDEWDEETSTLPCPNCNLPVYEDAEQCPSCQHYILPGAQSSSNRFPLGTQIMIWILILSLLLPAILGLLQFVQ
ncbi:MAG: hypothetical protein VX768_08590 [Planctomycetota bacterium]|nr:hypothetical protein [Planctomycetota bacterium]